MTRWACCADRRCNTVVILVLPGLPQGTKKPGSPKNARRLNRLELIQLFIEFHTSAFQHGMDVLVLGKRQALLGGQQRPHRAQQVLQVAHFMVGLGVLMVPPVGIEPTTVAYKATA